MIDRFFDVFRGTPEERKAVETIKRSEAMPKSSGKSARDLLNAEILTRRLFLRRVLVGGGVAAALAATGELGYLIASHDRTRTTPAETPEGYEETYLEYVSAFESVVGEDEEANRILGFFKERRKRGYLKGRAVLADEEGNTAINFYTAIVDPARNPESFNSMQGFAQYDNTAGLTLLLLKRVPTDRVWAGVILAHEALHVYQWLTGSEPSRPGGFMLGEQEAYELELRLLNTQTDGRLKEVLQRRAEDVEPDKYRGRLSSDDLREIASLFTSPKSRDEEDARISVYIIGLNYAVAESRAQNPEEVKRLKTDYIRSVFEGKIPLLG